MLETTKNDTVLRVEKVHQYWEREAVGVHHLTKFDVGGFDVAGGVWHWGICVVCLWARLPCHVSQYFIYCLLLADDSDSRGGTESADVIGRLRVSLHVHRGVRTRHHSDTSRRVVGRRQHGAQVRNSIVAAIAGICRSARSVNVRYCWSPG